MSVIDVERRVVRVCFGDEPKEEDLEALGDRRVWGIYREMVRARLLGEARIALRRTLDAAGTQLFERTFERHLREDPPGVRPFCAAPLAFAQSAERQWRSDAVDGFLIDLVRYEAALWEVSDLPEHDSGGIAEFDFERPAVLSAALRLLESNHPVHRRDESARVSEQTYLCVHRAPDEPRARTWTLTPFTHALMTRFATHEQSAAEAIKEVARQRSTAVDQNFLEGLTSVLAEFIERGIILGSR